MKTAFNSCALAMLAGLLTAAASTIPACADAKRDPRAVAIAQAMASAVAPDGAWDKIAGLRFGEVYRQGEKITGESHYTWDLKTGRFRFDGKGNDGGERTVIFDLPTGKGEGWVNVYFNLPPPLGHESEDRVVGSQWFHPPGPAQRAYLKFAYEHYINSTYSLFFPLKLKDPSVGLEYVGEQQINGQTDDVIKAVLPHDVGLSTGDTYYLYINRLSHFIDRWDYPPPPEKSDERPPVVTKSLAKTKNSHTAGPSMGAPPQPIAWMIASESKGGAAAPSSGKGTAPTTSGSTPATASEPASNTSLHTPASTQAEAAPASGQAANLPAGMVSWFWREYEAFGPLHLSTVRYKTQNEISITYSVEVLSSLPASSFATPTVPRVQELIDTKASLSSK